MDTERSKQAVYHTTIVGLFCIKTDSVSAFVKHVRILFNFQEFAIKELVWLSPQWLTFLKFDRLVTGQRFEISRTLHRFS